MSSFSKILRLIWAKEAYFSNLGFKLEEQKARKETSPVAIILPIKVETLFLESLSFIFFSRNIWAWFFRNIMLRWTTEQKKQRNCTLLNFRKKKKLSLCKVMNDKKVSWASWALASFSIYNIFQLYCFYSHNDLEKSSNDSIWGNPQRRFLWKTYRSGWCQKSALETVLCL